jgi:Bacterial membrane protein YfhO
MSRTAEAHPMSRANGRVAATCAWLVVAALVAAFADFLSSDRIPAYRDLLVFVVPFKHFLAAHLKRGELPLWNPWIYMGTPFLANLQSGVLYPPSVLFFLPFPLAFNSFLLAHFAAAAAGFWMLSRERGLAAAPSAVGSLTFALGGYLVSMVSLTNHLQAAVWMPWALFFWMRYERRGRFRDLACLSLTLAVFVLAGAPELLFMMLAVLAAWTLFQARGPLFARLRLEAVLVSAIVVALALVAFQVIPTIEYVGRSDRSATLPFVEVATWSLQPISLVQLLLPHSAAPGAAIDPARQMLETGRPWIRSIYLGLVPLCLAIGGLARRREGRFWGGVALAGMLLALGSATPVLSWLYDLFPSAVGKFRYPEKFYCLVHLAAAVLASDGALLLLRGERRCEELARTVALTLFGVASLLWLVRWFDPASYLRLVAAMTGRVAPMTDYVPLAEDLAAKALRGMLLLACFLAALRMRRASVLSPATTACVVVALVAADLASVAHGLNQTVSWRALQEQRPIMDVDALRSARLRMFLYQTVSAPFEGQPVRSIEGLEHRVQLREPARSFEEAAQVLWRTMLLDVPMVAEVGTLSGSDGIMRSSDNALRAAVSTASREGAVKLLRTFGVAELAGPTPLESAALEPMRAEGHPPTFVYRVRDPLPAAYLASRLVRATTAREAFQRMLQDDFIPGFDAIVEEMPPELPARVDAKPKGDVRVLRWSDGRIDLRAQTPGPALLVLNDSYFPGWRARVDGKPARIERANFLARGIALAAGDHRVQLVYRPRSLLVGTAVSIATLIALAVGITASWSRPAADRR